MRSKNKSSKSMSMKSISVVLIFALSVALILLLNLQHAYYAKATGSTNTIEDTFTQANQAGWGISTNYDSVPNVAWGTDANGSQPYVSIANSTGLFGYQGSTNVVGLATAGTTTYGNGADALVSFTMSSVGHVIPYVLLNACANKSCYYSAQLHTSQNTLEIGERKKNANTVLASLPFTASANTLYWMRLDTATDRSGTIEAKVWTDGTAEPGWMAIGNDNNALAANVVFYDTYLTRSSNAGTSFSKPTKISSASSDPDGSSTNSLAAQFLGDYITAVADSSHVYAVWTDSRNASTCAAVDAYRAGTGPKPDVITQCPTTFGNTDIFLGID